jgi:hypothetical protein
VSPTEIELSWRDNADNERDYRVEMAAGAGFRPLAKLAPDTTELAVTSLEPDTEYDFRVRATNGGGLSPYSEPLTLRTPKDLVAECTEAGVLCLHGGRFRVGVTWTSQHQDGKQGVGHPVPGGERSGYFWFFDEDNVELVVKVLDGRPVNGSFWVFYGGLSDVEYEVRVEDTVEQTSRTYRNAPGELCGAADTGAFPQGATAVASARPAPAAEGAPAARAAGPSGACVPSDRVLCLQDGRFEVAVDWHNHHTDTSGSGRVRSEPVGGEKTGFFWFFDPGNVELVVKLIDGRAVNGRFWFFFGSLSDVEYEVRVRDTVLDVERTYRNPAGNLCGQADTSAF